jgi:hypothetical protein
VFLALRPVVIASGTALHQRADSWGATQQCETIMRSLKTVRLKAMLVAGFIDSGGHRSLYATTVFLENHPIFAFD